MIPDHVIDGYLRSLFGNSEPGATLHYLLTAAANPDDTGPLGGPDPDKLGVTVYAIAPTADVDVDRFIAQSIVAAIVDTRRNNELIHFAGLVREVHGLADDGNEVTENQGRRLLADRKLDQHPAAIELTLLYAACRDGRRWAGTHVLTGPGAGTVTGPHLWVGGLRPQEAALHPRMVRAAVGLATIPAEVLR